jgi:hypothetical protein
MGINMNKVLKDPIAPRKVDNGGYPWEFKAPAYDNRSSCAMRAGNDYGVGFRTPVGMDKPRSIESGPIPQQAHAFSPEEIFYGKGAEDRKG